MPSSLRPPDYGRRSAEHQEVGGDEAGHPLLARLRIAQSNLQLAQLRKEKVTFGHFRHYQTQERLKDKKIKKNYLVQNPVQF